MKWLAGNLILGATVAGLGAGLAAALRRYRQHLGIERARSRDAESQTVAALQMRDHLLASASHDLKTPVAAIRLLVHVLKRDAQKGQLEPEPLKERLQLIEANVNRMSALINEMLDIARLQGGKPIELNPSEVDLVELAKRVADTLEIGAKSHRTVVEAEEPRLIGRWDAERLERLLTNLITNGLKYSPAGSEVTITLDRAHCAGQDLAVVDIHNGGDGIDAEDLPHVFEWFYRGRNAEPTSGTGVGLASAKLIAETHGGRISIDSHPSRGTTVTIQLPLERQKRQREDVQTDGVIPEAAGQSSPNR